MYEVLSNQFCITVYNSHISLLLRNVTGSPQPRQHLPIQASRCHMSLMLPWLVTPITICWSTPFFLQVSQWYDVVIFTASMEVSSVLNTTLL